jgi:hypothetical protein
LTQSPEYLATIVSPAYATYLGRAADAAGVAYWVSRMQQGLSDEQLEAAFIATPEFYRFAGGTDAGWVDAMYESLLGRVPDDNGKNYWVNQLAGGALRVNVAYGFASSPEKEIRQIDAYYLYYLGRPDGFAEREYWFKRGGNRESIIAGLTASDEYFARNTNP